MRVFNPSQETRLQLTWTTVMLIVLKENYLEMTDLQLSYTIGCSKNAVRQKMIELGLRRPKVKAVRVVKVKKEKTPKQLERENKKARVDLVGKNKKLASVTVMKSKRETLARESRMTIKTKQVDYSMMRAVKVDDKTSIYINMGEDPGAAIAKYKKNHPPKDYKIRN